MRFVLSHFMSLDGVVQGPSSEREDLDGGFRHGGWAVPYFDASVMGPAIDEMMDATDALLFGRKTYDLVTATYSDPASDDGARRLAALPKYVVSRTLDAANMAWPNTTVLGGPNPIAEIRRLKSEAAGTTSLMGSASLAACLVAEGLVDEYRLMIEPILLGGGKRIFPTDSWKRPLHLVSSETTPTGVLVVVYRPG